MDEHMCLFVCVCIILIISILLYILSYFHFISGKTTREGGVTVIPDAIEWHCFLDYFRSHDSETSFSFAGLFMSKTMISFLMIYFEENLVLYFKPCQKVLLRDHCLRSRSMTHDVTQGYISFSSSISARKLCECRMTTPNSATFYHPNTNWSIWYPWMLNNLKSSLAETGKDEIIKPYKSEMMLVNRKLVMRWGFNLSRMKLHSFEKVNLFWKVQVPWILK